MQLANASSTDLLARKSMGLSILWGQGPSLLFAFLLRAILSVGLMRVRKVPPQRTVIIVGKANPYCVMVIMGWFCSNLHSKIYQMKKKFPIMSQTLNKVHTSMSKNHFKNLHIVVVAKDMINFVLTDSWMIQLTLIKSNHCYCLLWSFFGVRMQEPCCCCKYFEGYQKIILTGKQ